MNFSKNERKKRMRSDADSDSKRCICQDKSGVFLNGRRISWLVSSVIMVCFFVFISGYFLGKKKAVEKFYRKIEQDSFADHVYYSMCSMYDKDGGEQQGQSVAEQEMHLEPGVAAIKQDADLSIASSKQEKTPEKKDSKILVAENVSALKVTVQDDSQFYAELIGFGTQRAARLFADKLLKDNVSVSVKKRKSKTARGKVITWYQVITGKFSDKGDLIALVDDISAQERLKDVRIVSC